MKFSFQLKNKTPKISDIHDRVIDPERDWMIMILFSIVCVLFFAIFSAFLSIKLTKEDADNYNNLVVFDKNNKIDIPLVKEASSFIFSRKLD